MKTEFITKRTKNISKIVSTLLLFTIMTSNNVLSQTLETVSNVDLKRYAGKWYEIASYPQRFQIS
jgi:apolipoprotein D and lipocalin family protein